MKMQFKKLHIW